MHYAVCSMSSHSVQLCRLLYELTWFAVCALGMHVSRAGKARRHFAVWRIRHRLLYELTRFAVCALGMPVSRGGKARRHFVVTHIRHRLPLACLFPEEATLGGISSYFVVSRRLRSSPHLAVTPKREETPPSGVIPGARLERES